MALPESVETRFNTDISYGSEGGPEFSTDIVETGGGNEQRNANWTYPRERWNVAYGVKTQAELQWLNNFFVAMRGRAVGFRFKNHDDYGITGWQGLGNGDGVEKDFQIIKSYGVGGITALQRKISKPVDGTVIVRVNSVEKTEDVDYTIEYTTGLISFVSAPGDGLSVTTNFEFDLPMRFDTDYLPHGLETYLVRRANVPLLELKL